MKAIDIADLLTIFGIFAMGFGLWLYRPWISLVVIGCIIFCLGVFFSIPKTSPKGKRK